MNKFFKDNIAGVLALSAAGSLIATWIARFIPAASGSGTSLLDVASRPIPVWILFPYSILLVLSFALWIVRTRQEDRDHIATILGERDAVRRQLEVLTTEAESLRRQLADSHSGNISRADLMRFVAVVLTSAKRSSSDPITYEYVCKHVAGLAGQGVPHAAIGEALASMLHIGAVAGDYQGLILVNRWKDKMREAGVPDVVQSTG